MAWQANAFQPTAFQSGGNVPDPALRNHRFTNGQTEEQVKGLVGFAGSALVWASLAALTAVPQPTLQAAEMTFGQHEAFVVQANQSAQYFNSCVIPGNILQAPARRPIFSARPQDDPTVIQPVTFEPQMLVAHDRGTFGSVYPDQELLEWNPSFFNRRFQSAQVASTVVPPKVQADVGPQESPEQPQPLWKGQVPGQSPAFKQWTIPPQENQEQTQPVLFGQQPLPAPALGPIRYTSSEADLSNRSIFWGGTATLPIAATQTILPALKPIIVAGQDSEPVQPIFVGQQPLPPPAFKPWTASPQENVRDFVSFWSGSQTLLGVVATAPVRQIAVVAQESTEQAQPNYWGGRATLNLAAIQFDLPPGHEFAASPQDSGEQFQPVVFGQQPLPSPVVGLSKVAAPSDPEVVGRSSEYAVFWEGHAALFIAATQYTLPPAREFATGPQENQEQTQPLFVGQQPLPSPAVGLSKVASPTASEIESAARASEYTAFWGGDATLPLAATQFDLPPGKRFTASPQESGEQQQPVAKGQTPLPSPVVGLSKVSAPSDVESIARSNEFATFWIGHASLFIAQSQFTVPPSHALVVSEQAQLEQPQPQTWGHNEDVFLAAFSVPLRNALVVPQQESGEQPQPIFAGQQPLPSPALGPSRVAGPIDTEQTAVQYATVWVGDATLYVAVTQDVPPKPKLIIGEQQSGEQQQPVFSGQQPLPSPAVGLSKVAAPSDVEAVARGSEFAAFWDGKATLQIAAVQFDLPPSKRVSAAPQESGEQYQPIVFGQQPLPSPALGSIKLAGPIDTEETAVQYGEVWVGDASLYVAVTQDVPRKSGLFVSGQESTDQIQPQVWGRNEDAFLAASTVPQKPTLIVGAQESGEQQQPIFSGQQPLPAPASSPIKVAAPSDPEAIARASESASFWDGKASLHIAAVQYDLPPSKRLSASPQESGEQTQPVIAGQQPLPSPQLGSTRLAGPIDVEQTAVQYGEFWVGDATLYVAVTQDVPAKHALIVGEQESTEQIQPQFAHPRITADSIASRFIWQSGDAEGSQSARFWHGQFIADLVPGEVQIRRTLFVPEQAYQFQPQPQFNLYYFLDSVDVVVPPVVTGGGGDRGVNLFREEKPKQQKVKPASFRVRFEQSHQTFAARFEAASELRIKWVAEPVLGEFQTELEASSEFRFRSVQQSGFALAFDVHGTQQKQVPVKAIHQSMRVGVEFVAPDSELHIRFEVEE